MRREKMNLNNQLNEKESEVIKKINEFGAEKIIEKKKILEDWFELMKKLIKEMKTEDLIDTYLDLRDKINWLDLTPFEFNLKNNRLNLMAEEIRLREYGKKKKTED